MAIDDRNVVSIPITPHKADAPLIVDANAVLSRAITFERFQSIARRCRKVAQLGGNVQLS